MEHDAINDSVDNSISRSKNMNVGLKKIINAIKCFDFDISVKDSTGEKTIKKEATNFQLKIDDDDLKTNIGYDGKKLNVDYNKL